MTVWKEIGTKIFSELQKLFARKDLLPAFLHHPASQRWLTIAILSIILTIILLPGFIILTPQYKPGAIADKNIKADRDFLVVERAATE